MERMAWGGALGENIHDLEKTAILLEEKIQSSGIVDLEIKFRSKSYVTSLVTLTS